MRIATSTAALLFAVPHGGPPALAPRGSLLAMKLQQPQRPPAPAAASDPASDWGGLPAAIAASKCGAINQQLVKAADADVLLGLVAKNQKQFNAVNAATALHRIAACLKRDRAQLLEKRGEL